MHKRRERDRPKVAPGSLYNPHKRVLLSYGTDDEDGGEEQTPTALEDLEVAGEPGPGAASDGEDQRVEETTESKDSTQENAAPPGSDAAGSHADQARDGSVENYESRRATRRNEATGQWAALGSLSYQRDDDDYDEDEEYDSAEEDAMAYLRSVRYERQSMPNVLTAPQATSTADPYENGVGDTRGYLEDGAYVASANMGPLLPAAGKKAIDPQEAYTTSLKERFHRQRERLHSSPALGAVEALDNDHPILFPWKSNKAHTSWHRTVRMIPPHPTQIQAMEQRDVLNVLKLLQRHFLVREKHIRPTTSSWIWALLTRLNDVGTMNNDQVWVLRELGKKTILVQLSFDDPDAAAQLEAAAAENEDQPMTRHGTATASGEELIDDPKTDEGEAEDYSVAGKNDDPEDDSDERQHTLATLDTILVVVGEIYGQRDLLEFRKSWERNSPNDVEGMVVE